MQVPVCVLTTGISNACTHTHTPVISPTDRPEWEATPQHLGTPVVPLLHMADGWFQNLEKQQTQATVVHRSEQHG